tara:strand:+ start:114961 stop:115329 length:369 start_codon:yes stop_codon:yes gene_type:complete
MSTVAAIRDIAKWIAIVTLVLIIVKWLLLPIAFVFSFLKLLLIPAAIVWLIATLLTKGRPSSIQTIAGYTTVIAAVALLGKYVLLPFAFVIGVVQVAFLPALIVWIITALIAPSDDSASQTS